MTLATIRAILTGVRSCGIIAVRTEHTFDFVSFAGILAAFIIVPPARLYGTRLLRVCIVSNAIVDIGSGFVEALGG